MYVVTPYPNIVIALDLSQPGAPCSGGSIPSRTRTRRASRAATSSIAALAYADGKLFFNTLDNQTIALDAASGKELWRVESRRYRAGETRHDGAARREGQGPGRQQRRRARRARLADRARCATGKQLVARLQHRTRSRRADRRRLQAVLRAGPRRGPRRQDVAAGRVEDRRRHGVGLDLLRPADLDLIYYGTGNPGPWNPEQRPGANKWTSGSLRATRRAGQARMVLPDEPARPARLRRRQRKRARRPAARWQAAQGPAASGSQRLRLRHGSRDRRSAVGNSVRVTSTTSSGVDLADGIVALRARQAAANRQDRPRHLSGLAGRQGLAAHRVVAAHEAALHPAPESLPGPGSHETSYIAGTPYVGAERQDQARTRDGHRGLVHGLGPGRPRKRAGRSRKTFPVWSGALVTAGDVVFYGTMDGWFKAVDAKDGTSSGSTRRARESSASRFRIAAPTASSTSRCWPVSADGQARWSRAISIRATEAPRSDSSTSMKDLKQRTTKGGMLYVFALP